MWISTLLLANKTVFLRITVTFNLSFSVVKICPHVSLVTLVSFQRVSKICFARDLCSSLKWNFPSSDHEFHATPLYPPPLTLLKMHFKVRIWQVYRVNLDVQWRLKWYERSAVFTAVFEGFMTLSDNNFSSGGNLITFLVFTWRTICFLSILFIKYPIYLFLVS